MTIDSPVKVFVRLCGEDLDVWRPVPAEPLGDGRFRLLTPNDFDSESETWEFLPNSVVRAEQRLLSGKLVFVATEYINPIEL